MIAAGVAVTALGTATVVEETDRVAFVRLDVEEVQDHDQPTFALEGGVRWHWTDDDAEQRRRGDPRGAARISSGRRRGWVESGERRRRSTPAVMTTACRPRPERRAAAR